MASLLTSWTCIGLILLSAVADAQPSFFPAATPLAVRSPHLSVWYDRAAWGGLPLSGCFPLFWSTPSNIGWVGRIRVDGVTYSWMGGDLIWDSTANVVSVQITPTRSIFVMEAGPMNITVTYLSPIEPSDWANQSLPFSYVSVEAQSIDGATHDVQFYSDISAELVSGFRPDSNGQGGDPVRWRSNRTARALYHEIEPYTMRPYTERSDQAEDGRGYYAMALSPSLTWQIDTDQTSRHQFQKFGQLTNTSSNSFGPMGPNPWYVFAIAANLGSIQSTSSPVTWAIGYVRDPVISYTTPSGATEIRRPYWTTRYSDINILIDAFVSDYSAAHERAVALDERIMGDAARISPQYANLVSLVARQAMGALDITVLGSTASDADATDVKGFMKDIGSTQRVNPVETLFAAFPAYLYMNASLGGALLAPLLESQDSLSGQPYAAQDIGSNYPNATGPRGDMQQGIEQSGNMLIMMYAHARVSGDGLLLSRHYDTAKRWADYLANNTLIPLNQVSADGLANANMTNLAIKGIIGVKAMAEMSRAIQNDADAQRYDELVTALTSSWLSLAESGDHQHLLGQYGDQLSSAMIYNVYGDLLLDTSVIPQDTLTKQTQYYKTLLQTANSALGLHIDSALGNTTSTAWMLFTAATVTDVGVRDSLIQYAWERAIFVKTTSGEFPDVYNDVSGDISDHRGGRAGAALGAVFAPLALTVAPTAIAFGKGNPGNGDDGNTPSNSGHSRIGAIVGGAIGGAVFLAIAVGIGFFLWRRRRLQDPSSSYHYKEDLLQYPQPYLYGTTDEHDRNADRYADTDGAGLAEGRPTKTAIHSSSMNTLHGAPSPAAVVSSPKARDHTHEVTEDVLLPQSGNADGSAPLPPGRDVSAMESRSGRLGSNSHSTTDLVDLRAEVENLKRVVQGIREERLDPPPEYGE